MAGRPPRRTSERSLTPLNFFALFASKHHCVKYLVMKFRFLLVGKTKEKHYRALQEEYLERLSHFVRYEVVEVRAPAPHETGAIESNRILEKLNHSSFVCLLDSRVLCV